MSYSSEYKISRRRSRGRFALTALFVLLLVAGALAFWRVGPAPTLAIETSVPGIGPSTEVTGRASQDGRGLGDLELELVQQDRVWLLSEATHEPRPFWAFWGSRVVEDVLTAQVDGPSIEGLAEGEATLRLSAGRAPTWFRRPAPAVLEVEVPVHFRPPSLDLGPVPVSVRQSGSGVVVYRVGPSATRSGVTTGESFFPGYPVPGGGPQDRFALFAAPYDDGDPSRIRLVVADDLGNEVRSAFITTYTAKPLKRSEIRLNDAFLDKVVGEITSRTPGIAAGPPLETYLRINGELRAANAAELRKLAEKSALEFTWNKLFRQQPNSQLMDDFAARRTYVYDGQQVDTQDHLGFDLASVKRAPIVAANRGRVIMASYFGIYGNTVVLDHGYGLLSLYAHLSSIDVQDGQMVEQGGTLGRSGESGLAGGDHLHFSILVGGEPVDPLEWFDAKWISSRLGEAVPSFDFQP